MSLLRPPQPGGSFLAAEDSAGDLTLETKTLTQALTRI